jgi:hypothetical protein
MAGYGVAYAKETRIKGIRRPNVNVCGSCGDECEGLLCVECRGTLAPGRADEKEADDGE